ncbi:ABC transporter permease [Chloroflexi bacterium TSY]|nr:ABC transporter permease [Chloroflexi bacterium TSY]
MFQYIVRRVLLAIPTLCVISIIAFIIIQLPPGDYLTTYIATLSQSGQQLAQDEIDALRRQYGLDQPIYIQYFKWVWNMLRGDFGMSLEWQRPVADLIGERLLLTILLSFFTIVFTWLLAIPIGIYSATRQYSILDYVFTFFGFLGLGIPNFMIALILLWYAYSSLGMSVSGLFSPEFVDAPWTMARFIDMLKHLWIPMIILGLSGTAELIRIMRANLLDELNKPYVETARAKGVSEQKLILKYPTRVAINPFISTIGWTLPALVSGSLIVSVVLSLPTAGPLLLRALMSQDMYLAGTFLMLLSFLTVLGTLISDILLAWVDPRIRYGEDN